MRDPSLVRPTAVGATFRSSVCDSMLEAVGQTPAVRLRRLVDADCASVVVKLEYYNPTGSYKDRMAVAVIEAAERRGELRPGMTVIEYTGGSTGSSLALVCAMRGYRFVALSSDAWAKEKLDTMRALGAEVRVYPSEGGKVTRALIQHLEAETERLASEPGVYWARQFTNDDAFEGYAGIGRELLEQTGGSIAAFCAGVGTASMLVGAARALRAGGCDARIVALEPASSPVLTEGRAGGHRVEGIAVGFVPPHLAPGSYDEARAVEESDARETARRLAREEGIFAGTSTGLNVAAALMLARELGPKHTVATVAVDTGLKYLAGELYA